MFDKRQFDSPPMEQPVWENARMWKLRAMLPLCILPVPHSLTAITLVLSLRLTLRRIWLVPLTYDHSD